MSWPHSGFHLHASEPFSPQDRESFLRRLAYAFRTPVSLSRLSYGQDRVFLSTRSGRNLTFTPLEFPAHLSVHIPDRYQHVRRYAGLYASATRRFLGLPTKTSIVQTEGKPITPRWASLLARIFGTLPIECPRCGIEMKLSGFETDLRKIKLLVPKISRAPPRKKLETFFDMHGRIPFLVAAEEMTSYQSEAEISQAGVESNDEFDQRQEW
ncbi:MAG: transposase [Pseudomonadota bacterium]